MDRRFRRHLAGSAMAHGALLVMMYSLPPSPVPPPPLIADVSFYALISGRSVDYRGSHGSGEVIGPGFAAGEGRPHPAETGRAGTPKATSSTHFARRGPADEPEPSIALPRTMDELQQAGVLGILSHSGEARIGSVFGKNHALGNDPEDVLGGLEGRVIGEALGEGGLGLRGTGRGGGCGTCAAGSIGVGAIGTWGHGGAGLGLGYARVGGVGNRHARAPDVVAGTAQVIGALDPEIIRRVVRKHVNEVRYCFELDGNPGRSLLDFTIAPDGRVVAARANGGSAALGACLTQAVRRWDFPRPFGGGAAQVHYPFVFQFAGG